MENKTYIFGYRDFRVVVVTDKGDEAAKIQASKQISESMRETSNQIPLYFQQIFLVETLSENLPLDTSLPVQYTES